MKVFKSISVLSLITLTKVIQASYVAFDDGKVVTSSSTCLKLDKDRLVSKPCSEADDFTLENNKFCLKSDPTNCLSGASKKAIKTYFSKNTANHFPVTEFDENRGCLSIDYNGTVLPYKYHISSKMFLYNVENLQTGAPNNREKDAPIHGDWKQLGKCWTTKVKSTGSPFNKVYLQQCRYQSKNDKQGNKTQHWKLENGQIKTGDNVMCITARKGRIGATRCVEKHTLFTLLDDGQIAIKDRPGMCLTRRINLKKMGLGKCAQKLKLVATLSEPVKYTFIKNSNATFTQEGNVAKIGNTGSYSWSTRFGNIVVIKENWNYYTLKMNRTYKYTNFGVASRNEGQFSVWGGDLGYTKKNSISCFSGASYKKIYNTLGATRKISDTTQYYMTTGTLVKVIKTDTYVEFRCLSCGDTLIHRYTFVAGDYKNLYPAVDTHFNLDSYDMVIY